MDFKIAVLAGDGIGPEISVPVSYTHLDVYKRQVSQRDTEFH